MPVVREIRTTGPATWRIILDVPTSHATIAVQHGESKRSTIEKNTPVTVELNEAGNVIGIRKTG